jgi:hypothetical protein
MVNQNREKRTESSITPGGGQRIGVSKEPTKYKSKGVKSSSENPNKNGEEHREGANQKDRGSN